MSDFFGFIWNGESDKNLRITDPAAGNIEFDCVDTETHDWSRDVTTNPVENGSPIADHIIDQPARISITGMISNAPIKGYAGQISDVISGSINDDLVSNAFNTLESLINSKELITIYTRYKVYTNMVLQSVSIPRSVDSGDAIVFTVQAVNVRIVTSQTTNLPKGVGVKKSGKGAGKSNSKDNATKNRSGNSKDNGKSTAEVQRSTAKYILNYFKG